MPLMVETSSASTNVRSTSSTAPAVMGQRRPQLRECCARNELVADHGAWLGAQLGALHGEHLASDFGCIARGGR